MWQIPGYGSLNGPIQTPILGLFLALTPSKGVYFGVVHTPNGQNDLSKADRDLGYNTKIEEIDCDLRKSDLFKSRIEPKSSAINYTISDFRSNNVLKWSIWTLNGSIGGVSIP